MTRKSVAHLNCSWAKAAEVLGDKWSILIIRDAFMGARTFSSFEKSFGVSKGVLTQRLEYLVTEGILKKSAIGIGSSRYEYQLTAKGEALYPLLVALGQWGDEWLVGEGKEPWLVVDTKTEKPIKKLAVHAKDNRELAYKDITFRPGPGANDRIREIAEEIQRS